MKPNFQNDLIEKLKVSTYKKNLSFIKLKSTSSVLDIGSGTCLLRLILPTQAIYTAFEPGSYPNQALYLRPTDKLIKDYFNSIFLTDEDKFDYIFALTVIDEIQAKRRFLEEIKRHTHTKTKIYVAVRNRDFPLRRKNYVKNSHGNDVRDLSCTEWRDIFRDYRIISERKFKRPLLNSNIVTSIKLLLIRLTDYILPIEKSYMILFELEPFND